MNGSDMIEWEQDNIVKLYDNFFKKHKGDFIDWAMGDLNLWEKYIDEHREQWDNFVQDEHRDSQGD